MQPFDYSINKAISVGAPLGLLFVFLFFFSINNPVLWLILIVITHTLGYVHFILGFKYQLQAIIKSNNTQKFFFFWILTGIGLLVSFIGIVSGYIALLSIIAIGYFLIHGVLNEVTVMEKQFGHGPARSLMLPLVFYLLPFFLLSLTHPSFFFTPQLQFLNPPPEMAVSILQEIITIDLLQGVSAVCLLLFCILVPFRLLWQGSYIAGSAILFTTFISAYVFLDVKPINYVVLYFILLSYHFISWSLYFYQVYRRKFPERIPRYIAHHSIVLIPLVLLSLLAITNSSVAAVHTIVFNGLLFITFAMVHNTTSLLNEEWFQKLVNITEV